MELATHTDQIEPRKRRVMDTSNADARRAVSDMMTRFPAWREDVSRFEARVERRFSVAERQHMLVRCAEIADEVMATRTELLLDLADAPQSVAGNSRVVDMERALDNIEAAMSQLQRRLLRARD